MMNWTSLLLLVIVSLLPIPSAGAEPGGDGGRGAELEVAITSPGAGYVSLAVHDAEGRLVRTLLAAEPVQAGERRTVWDATSDLGLPVEAGEYSLRGIYFEEQPEAEFVLKVGKSGNPPYRTPDGRGDWGGNLGFPSALAANSDSVVMVYSCVEDPQITGIQQMDAEGNILMRYASFYPWDLRMAAAMDEENLFLGIGSIDRKTVEIAEYVLGEPRGKILTKLPAKPHEDTTETVWRGRWDAWLSGLAVTPERVYATIAADNAFFIVDRENGKILKRLELDAPSGVAVRGEELLVVSGRRVVRLSLEGKPLGTLVDEGVLKAPNSLALDSQGRVYVGDGGRVKILGPEAGGAGYVFVFSPQGELERTIGAEGGAAEEGAFVPGAVGRVTAVAVGPGGNVWVNDVATGFPRTSRWSAEGELERQWFARKISLWADSRNPGRPDEVLWVSDSLSDEPGMSAWRVDLGAGTWEPAWHYSTSWEEMYQEDVFLSFRHNHPLLKRERFPVFDYNDPTFVTHGDRHYFLNGTGNGDGTIFMYDGESQPRPVALVSYHRSQRTDDGRIEGFYDQGPNNWFTWADRDGDGRMAMDEIIFTEEPESLAITKRIYEATIDDDMTIHMKRLTQEGGKEYFRDAELPVREVLESGVPVYDWADLRQGVSLEVPNLAGGDGVKRVGTVVVPIPLVVEDSYFALIKPQPEEPLRLAGIDGDGWWASRNWRHRLVKWDAEGKVVWAVGRRAAGLAEPGQIYHPVHLAGEAEGALFIADTLGMAWVWTTDGYFLGGLFNGPGVTGEPSLGVFGEIQSMNVWTDPQSQDIYLAFSDTGNSIHRVTLPEITAISGGTVRVTPAQAAAAEPWDPDGRAPAEAPEFTAGFTATAPEIDGRLEDLWYRDAAGERRPEALVLLDGRRLAGVQVLHDRERLYLAYDVLAPHGPVNAGTELPYAAFASGAYVDFVLAPRWDGRREDIAAGDVRVLLAQIVNEDEPERFHRAYWPIRGGGENPQTIRSPAASIDFDDISEVRGLEFAFSDPEAEGDSGMVRYRVEVAVPLASLGLEEVAGKTVGFDVSVGVANEAGDRRERAAHWTGLSEGVVVDRPGSAKLLPHTWGTLHFEAAGD